MTQAWSAFTLTMTSGATLTSAIDLQGGWINAYLVIPTMTSNTQIAIQTSDKETGTFRRVKHPTINSSTVATNDYIIASSATNCVVAIPGGLRYVKVETTATVDAGATFQILCGGV